MADRVRFVSAWEGPPAEARTTWLLSVVRAIDLTTLSGDDTAVRVRGLCRRARAPLGRDLRVRLQRPPTTPRVAAVCVYPVFVPQALEALEGSGVRVATVAGGFPHGLSPLEARIREVRAARALGAHEIDIVIRREWALTGKWTRLYDEVAALREAAGGSCLKVILGTGELTSLTQVSRAALTVMMAGAAFVKTSTGKEKVNATVPVGIALAKTIGEFRERTGYAVGLKPAGGIATVGQALEWVRLAAVELGTPWLEPGLFRIGASSLLDAVLEALLAEGR
jgi:deoxyribose-phosphate aldolase